MKPFQSMKGRLLVLTLSVSLIPIITITTIYYFNARNTLKYEIAENLRAIAESKEQRVLSAMEKIKLETVDLCSDEFMRNTFETIVHGEASQHHEVVCLNRYLSKNKLPLYQHLIAIILVNKYGKIISSTNEKLLGNDFSDQDIFRQAISKSYGESYVGQPQYSPYLGLNCIGISAPVISMNGIELLGVVINAYSLAILNDITTNRVRMRKTGEVYLVNKNKVMFTESRFIDSAILKQIVNTGPVRKIIEDGKETVGIYKNYMGVTVVGALAYLPKYDWTLLTEIHKAEVFVPIKILGSVALILGLISASVAIGAGIAFAVSTSKPINDLTNAAKRFTSGDLNYRVEGTRKDEIGDLTHSFNTMAEEFAREMSERKSAEEGLRHRIDFEKTVATISTRFVILSDFNAAVSALLVDIGRLSKASRAYLFQFRDNGNIVDNTHEWCDDGGVTQEIQNLQNLPSSRFLWGMANLHAGNVIHIPDVSKMPPEATAEKEILEKQGIKSLLILPVYAERKLVGFIGFDNVTTTGAWHDEDLSLLTTTSEIIGNAIARKRMEEELRNSEKKYRTLVDEINDGFFVLDDQGVFTFANRALADIHGVDTPDDLIGKTIEEFIAPETRIEMMKAFRMSITTGKFPEVLEVLIIRNGSLAYIEIKPVPIVKEDGRVIGVRGVVRDVTERKRVEKELKALKESLEQRIAERAEELIKINKELQVEIAEHKRAAEDIKLLQTITFAIAEAENFYSALDVVLSKVCEATGWVYGEAWLISPDGKHLEYNLAWNRNAKELEKLKKRSKKLIFLPGYGLPGRVWSSKKPEWILEEVVNREFPDAQFVKEFGFKAAMGIPVLTNDEVIAVLTFFVREKRDKDERLTQLVSSIAIQLGTIIQRKQAEDALRMSESKYRLLLENLPQRIFYKDKNSSYVSCNENLARDFHIKPDEISGKTDYNFFPKEPAEKYRADDKRIMKSGRTEEIEEKYIKDGRELIVHMVKTPIKDEKGDIVGILGIFWDITEKIALQTEAIRNRHLVALGELAAGVGHEINNPTTGVINCAQILSNKSTEGSDEKDIARRIIKEGERIANIVHSLLCFARPNDKKEKKSKISIHEILSDTLILTEVQLRKEGIKIRLDIPQTLPGIIIYPQQIQQVFLNIISNARYALNQKYPERHANKLLEILGEEIVMNNRSYVKITFYDHGTGIPADITDKVMDPFFTTKPRGKGTGLGLSISHSIISDHGGKILIDSIEGEFTKVIILLPVNVITSDSEAIHV